jgi:hypothetical protein
MRESVLKFRLRLNLPDEHGAWGVAPEIQHLGRNATKLATALHRLSGAGDKHAKSALRLLHTYARKYRAESAAKALKSIEDEEILPIDLHPSARWKLDKAGIFALQLLLWLRHLQRKPSDEVIGDAAAELPSFDDHTARDWWHLARFCLIDIYPHPDRVVELAALAKDLRCETSAVAASNYIQRKIRERFESFAPPAVGYRN